jgi:hypothetical protein
MRAADGRSRDALDVGGVLSSSAPRGLYLPRRGLVGAAVPAPMRRRSSASSPARPGDVRFRDFCVARHDRPGWGAGEHAVEVRGKTRYQLRAGTTVIVLLDGAADDREAVTRATAPTLRTGSSTTTQ